jgi:histidine triad (HIT) family protein
MSCPFCMRILNGEFDHEDTMCVAFEPLNPVTSGHLLVVPKLHVADALERPSVTANTVDFAARLVSELGIRSCNVITSVGPAATQTIRHLHIHIVPRREGDGLSLPWTGQRKD